MCVCLCQQHMWLSWVCREGASRAWDGGGEECCSLAKKFYQPFFGVVKVCRVVIMTLLCMASHRHGALKVNTECTVTLMFPYCS